MAITGVGGAPAIAPQTAVQPAAAAPAGGANATGQAIDQNMQGDQAITEALGGMAEQMGMNMWQNAQKAGEQGKKIVDEMIQEMKK